MDAMTKHQIKQERIEEHLQQQTYLNHAMYLFEWTHVFQIHYQKPHNKNNNTYSNKIQPRNFSRTPTLMTSTRKLHGCTYTLMASKHMQYKMMILEFSFICQTARHWNQLQP